MLLLANNKRTFLYWCYPVLILHCFLGIKTHAQCINLSGRILNSKNNQFVSANIQVRVNGQKRNSGVSRADGQFNLEIPCGAQSLVLSAKDFRPMDIPITIPLDTGAYFAQIYMIPLDKEIAGIPYAQSEQSHIVLNNASVSANDKTAKRIFKVVDAFSSQAITSNVCLFFTKNGDKQCFTIKNGLSDTVVFKEKDIIAIEADAVNYQSYRGNMIVDPDNKIAVYEIGLSRTPLIISGRINLAKDNILQEVNLSDSKGLNIKTALKGNQFYSSVKEPGRFTIRIISKKQTFEKTVNIKAGISFFRVNEPEKKEVSPKIDSIAKPDIAKAQYPKRNNIDVVYFEQSDYNLTKFARIQLDSIFTYLINNPEIRIQILGHTDNVGNPELNAALGEYRAKIIYTYLKKGGINSERMSWMSYGSLQPVSSNEDENNKKKNRRAEIIYTSN